MKLNEFVLADQQLPDFEKTVRKMNSKTDHCNNNQITESDVEVNADIANDDNLVKFVKSGKKLVQLIPKVRLSESGKRTNFCFFPRNILMTIWHTKTIFSWYDCKTGYREKPTNDRID
jgi:hypothetical protein